MGMRLAGIILALGAMTATAWGQPEPVGVRQKQKGTHFIAEANVGGAFGTGFSEDGMGFGFRATLGGGGAFRGFPVRSPSITRDSLLRRDTWVSRRISLTPQVMCSSMRKKIIS